ncbi:MAG TPA: FliM/FliN family flagellar motor switch protein [Candidatus Baltobacteraceae bacterium]|nr:FliM/FliN family flagellar motor switch protein [Candidatus Baltobacteraceae bacterium]
MSAACVVANGVREVLGQLFGEPAHVRLFEPAIPSAQAWEAIAAGAALYRIRGTRADAMVVVRDNDAAALVGHVFGEAPNAGRALSGIEQSVLDRAVAAIAGSCAAVCGAAEEPVRLESSAGLHGFITFFELQFERPLRARIGIALSRDPAPEARGGLRIDDLLDLKIEAAVRVACADLQAAQLLALEPGAIVPITCEKVLRGNVLLAGRPLHDGECGVRDGRFALAVDVQYDERSNEAVS